MKHLVLTTIAAVLVVGCGESKQSAPAPESKPVEPVAEVAKPEPPTAKAPDISIHDAAEKGNIEAINKHLDAGTDVNAKDKGFFRKDSTPLHHAALKGQKKVVELLIEKGADVNAKCDVGWTPLHNAAAYGHKEIIELLIAKSADVNAKNKDLNTPLDLATKFNRAEIAALLRKHGGKTGAELKAEGK